MVFDTLILFKQVLIVQPNYIVRKLNIFTIKKKSNLCRMNKNY